MPRVRWYPTTTVFLCLYGLCSSFWIASTHADCWYDDRSHEEGTEVATGEPCLNCTCSRGALLCYLRVCPHLPNPPPPGCILLHRYKKCCPELICTDIAGGGNSLEARSEPEGIDLLDERSLLGNACVANGSIYAPGSAMDSSSLCEFCYCLSGRETCVKPKCLLPIEGCVPLYDDNNCCPVHYNCTQTTLPSKSSSPSSTSTTSAIPSSTTVSSTTTLAARNPERGCVIDNIYFPEGGKVLGVGHSVCDNCYCLRGLLRCEPLSCAPPLLGCLPVIRPGECCAASYNCSGTIEIQPEPNYGQYPIVSKEYAKLRKEVQRVRPTPKVTTRKDIVTEDSNLPFYVIAETQKTTANLQRSSGSTTRQFVGFSFNTSTNKPFYYKSMEKESISGVENKHSTRSYPKNKVHGTNQATTNHEFQSITYKKSLATTSPPSEANSNSVVTPSKIESEDYFGFSSDALLSIVDSLLDGGLGSPVETKTPDISTEFTTTELSEETTSLSNDILFTTTEEELPTSTYNSGSEFYTESTTFDSTMETTENTDEPETTTVTDFPTSTEQHKDSEPITLKTVLNSTDCTGSNISDIEILEKSHESNFIEVTTVLPVDASEINKLAEVMEEDNTLPTTVSEEVFTETTDTDDVTEVDLESKVKVANANLKDLPKTPAEIEAILNISKKNADQEYGDYDYNEPSLPPSLPNLRIIPFVAADALETKKGGAEVNAVYPSDTMPGGLDAFSYTLFSPPVETEGGFIPKEPPILEKKTNEVNCISDGLEVAHGQLVEPQEPCMTCSCYYGNIVCQTPSCPPIPGPECREAILQDHKACCPQYICDEEEAPTVVLDRSEAISNTQKAVTLAEGVASPDPFRHVIRTEPAPDLQLLIGDMMPYLARKTTTPLPRINTEKTTRTTTIIQITTPENEENSTENQLVDDFSLDKVLQLLLTGEKSYKTETTTKKIQTTESIDTTINVAPSSVKPQNATTSSPVVSRTPEGTTKNVPKHPNSVDSSGVGLLKLAGCNIYGRMYRVGRIISELSGPCIECKCTEIGVQCRDLKC